MSAGETNNKSDAGAVPALLRGKRIAIAGAGPCGLTLARLLQMQGGDVRVFEVESSTSARNQGGSLDLHVESGQRALRKAGLYEKFVAACRPEGQAIRVVDKRGKMFVDLRPQDDAQSRPEIDRGQLRSLLMDSLDPGTIAWGRPIESVEQTAQGRLRLNFADGRCTETDLLFGCDGAWSRVRSYVSTTRPYYCGITIIEVWIRSVDTRHPDIAEMVGPGIFLATSDNKALIGQRNGDGNIRVYVAFRVPEDWTQHAGICFDRADSARQGLLKMFEGWAPQLRALLEVAEVFIPRSLYTHPPRQAAWLGRENVTLLGDAAHVMPFFTGKGVNLAMLDALEVDENLTSGKFSDVNEALRAYETRMLDRMAEAIAETLADGDIFFSNVAPAGIPELFQRRLEASRQQAEQRS